MRLPARLTCLDTRLKIITADAARQVLRSRPGAWITGDFDPLLAAHVEYLKDRAADGRVLIVEIANPPHPLLSQRARAELVAALRMVDYVVVGQGDVDGPAPDAAITRQFINHIVQRHRTDGAG